MLLFFLIALLSFLLQLILPWWSMMIAAFVISFFFGKKSSYVFFAGFFGCAVVWLLMEMYVHLSRGDLMTGRIAALLTLPGTAILYATTLLIAGVAGGISGLAGFYLRQI
ncbi:MAG: hypothetical protein ABIQ74_13795, partial [Chitinophagales bacterium]